MIRRDRAAVPRRLDVRLDQPPADPAGAPLVGATLVSPDGRHYAYSNSQPLFELFLVDGVFGGRPK